MNASRIIGPLVAGAVIASAGSAWVFLLNAVLSLGAAVIISRWKREHKPNPLGRERLGSAMRVGWQYVTQSYLLKGVLLRIWIFFFHSTVLIALLALLALLARDMQGGGAGTFTLLLASMGAGAIASTAFLPWLRRRYSRDGLVLRGAALQATAMAATDQVWFAVPAMFLGGGGMDHHGKHAQCFHPDGTARLGSRPRNVDLPDGHHGSQCEWRGTLGSDCDMDQRSGQSWHSVVDGLGCHGAGQPRNA